MKKSNEMVIDEKKLESIIRNAVENGIVEAIKTIYSDKKRLVELLEDIGLVYAMEQGETGEYMSREELFNILDGEK